MDNQIPAERLPANQEPGQKAARIRGDSRAEPVSLVNRKSSAIRAERLLPCPPFIFIPFSLARKAPLQRRGDGALE